MAGGLATAASGQKVTIERILNRETRFIEEYPLDANGLKRELRDGDLVNVYTLSPRIANAVTFTGHIDAAARTELLARCAVLVQPSYRENFGMAVAEAMAQGVPVIVSEWVRENLNASMEDLHGPCTRKNDKCVAARNWIASGLADPLLPPRACFDPRSPAGSCRISAWP